LFHELSNLLDRRQDADEAQRTAADDFFAVHQHRELPVAAFDQFHIETCVSPE
jgi:hypothetical protein